MDSNYQFMDNWFNVEVEGGEGNSKTILIRKTTSSKRDPVSVPRKTIDKLCINLDAYKKMKALKHQHSCRQVRTEARIYR